MLDAVSGLHIPEEFDEQGVEPVFPVGVLPVLAIAVDMNEQVIMTLIIMAVMFRFMVIISCK
jgi:hypothetical protein